LVVFDFAESRAGRHPAEFLGHPGEDAWRGTLVCDDYSGYKALFASGVTEAGCLAHARRKFHELWVNHKSAVGEQALAMFARLYEVEREVADLDAEGRWRMRQDKAKPIADALHAWVIAQRQKVPPGSATAKAIDYSLGRWAALVRYIEDGRLPSDNNWVENQIGPIAIGRRRLPGRVMLVAAHHDDLAGARACGLRTAYIERPFEFGTARPKDVSSQAGGDLHCESIVDLADVLGVNQ
jgi:transposase